MLPPPSWDFKFKGSVAAAIDASTFVLFGWIGFVQRFADAYTVPVSMKQNAQGSYLFFKDFHDQTSRTYSDYSLVPSADESNDENELSAAKPCGSSDSKGSRTSSC